MGNDFVLDDFVRQRPTASPREIVEAARALGRMIVEAQVVKVRQGMSEAKSGEMTKTEWVRQYDRNNKPRVGPTELVRIAAKQGVQLTPGLVSTIRSAAKSKPEPKKKSAAKATKKKPAESKSTPEPKPKATKPNGVVARVEDRFKSAASWLGYHRAHALLDEMFAEAAN